VCCYDIAVISLCLAAAMKWGIIDFIHPCCCCCWWMKSHPLLTASGCWHLHGAWGQKLIYTPPCGDSSHHGSQYPAP